MGKRGKRKREADEDVTDAGELLVDKRPKTSKTNDPAPDRYARTQTFIVGSECTSYTIHEDFLRLKLGEKAERGDWFTNAEQENPAIFGKFIVWLYTGQVPPSQTLVLEAVEGRERLVEGKRDAVGRYSDLELVSLWRFGVDNDIPELFNTALSLLARQNNALEKTTSKDAVEQAFAYTGPRKNLQRYLIDEAAYRFAKAETPVRNPENTSSFPAEYVAGILNAIVAAKVPAAPPGTSNHCEYHSHGNCGKDENLRRRQIACRKLWRDGGPKQTVDANICDLFQNTVRILVGPRAAPFIVHKDLLCSISTYFSGAFKGGFSEGKTQSLTLDNESVVSFQMFVDWLYGRELRPIQHAEREALESMQDEADAKSDAEASSHDQTDSGATSTCEGLSGVAAEAPPGAASSQDLPLCVLQDDPSSIATAQGCRQIQSDLIDLYILADRRQIPTLQNAIMTKLVELRVNHWPLLSTSPTFVNRVFKELLPYCKLCEYVVEEAALFWKCENKREVAFFKSATGLPLEFLGRLVHRVFADRSQEEIRPRFQDDICVYHEHEEDAQKEECKVANQHVQAQIVSDSYGPEMGEDWVPRWDV